MTQSHKSLCLRLIKTDCSFFYIWSMEQSVNFSGVYRSLTVCSYFKIPFPVYCVCVWVCTLTYMLVFYVITRGIWFAHASWLIPRGTVGIWIWDLMALKSLHYTLLSHSLRYIKTCLAWHHLNLFSLGISFKQSHSVLFSFSFRILRMSWPILTSLLLWLSDCAAISTEQNFLL